MSERPIYTKNRLRRATIAAITAIAVGNLSSCAASDTKPPSAVANTVLQPTYVQEVPDMSGFLQAGSTTKCFNGGDRPCAPLIRESPQLDAAKINTDPTKPTVTWPLESYNGKLGDSLSIVCYTEGQLITPYVGTISSDQWLKVIVPRDRVASPVIASELQSTSPSLETIQFSGQTAVLGYASVEWFNHSAHDPMIPHC
jgi:hypothetical protein